MTIIVLMIFTLYYTWNNNVNGFLERKKTQLFLFSSMLTTKTLVTEYDKRLETSGKCSWRNLSVDLLSDFMFGTIFNSWIQIFVRTYGLLHTHLTVGASKFRSITAFVFKYTNDVTSMPRDVHLYLSVNTNKYWTMHYHHWINKQKSVRCERKQHTAGHISCVKLYLDMAVSNSQQEQRRWDDDKL